MPEIVKVFDGALAQLPPPPEVAAPAPNVVATIPRHGDIVEADALTEIRVEFDSDMHPGGYSFSQRSAETFPATAGPPRWLSPRVCVLSVRLEPGKSYWIGINVPPFTSFRSVKGVPAKALALEFRTKEQASDGGAAD
jgi:hypothetical protein